MKLNWIELSLQQEQKLWAVDLNLWYDDSVAMTLLMLYVTGGTLDTQNYVFNVPPVKKEKKKSKHRRKFEYTEPEVRDCIDKTGPIFLFCCNLFCC